MQGDGEKDARRWGKKVQEDGETVQEDGEEGVGRWGRRCKEMGKKV